MHDAGMPTVTLRFRLPDEEPEFRDACDGGRAKAVLHRLDEHLRSQIKHSELPAEVETALQELREWVAAQCYDLGVEV